MLRPHARTVEPDGREWEIYAYKLRLRRPRRARRRIVRQLLDLPVAAVRALRSDEWTIEAVSWAPYPLRHRWSTTAASRDQVLAQVEGGLARGATPHPRQAVQLLGER
jgi:hypothetical protein